jgi:hypothetical protein
VLIDVAVPRDRNMIQKEALTIEIQRMWNVNLG